MVSCTPPRYAVRHVPCCCMPALLCGRSGNGLPPHLVMPCETLSRWHREEPTPTCRCQPPLGVVPSLVAPRHRKSRNPRATTQARCTPFSASTAQAMVEEANNRGTHATAAAATGSSSSTRGMHDATAMEASMDARQCVLLASHHGPRHLHLRRHRSLEGLPPPPNRPRHGVPRYLDYHPCGRRAA